MTHHAQQVVSLVSNRLDAVKRDNPNANTIPLSLIEAARIVAALSSGGTVAPLDEAKWWAGSDDEWFTEGPFETREDAVAEGQRLAEEDELDGFYIALAVQQHVSFSAHRMISEQYFEHDDWFDYERVEPNRLGDAEAADKELQTLIDGWLNRWRHTFVQPTMFASCKSEWIKA